MAQIPTAAWMLTYPDGWVALFKERVRADQVASTAPAGTVLEELVKRSDAEKQAQESK